MESDVDIGTGAEVLGPIRVGRGAAVGANAVVAHDVPGYAVVAGFMERAPRLRNAGETATKA